MQRIYALDIITEKDYTVPRINHGLEGRRLPQLQRKKKWVIPVLAGLLAAGILVSFLLGRYPVPPDALGGILLNKFLEGVTGLWNRLFPRSGADLTLAPFWEARMETVALKIRLPRILLACLVGCCLSTSGAAYQGVFQNPMAAPDILGATSGAAFGAALAILLGGSSHMITISAFFFSLITMALALLISRTASGKRVLTLVLSGIMVSSLFNAGTSYIKLVADPGNQLPAITYWLMGSLSGAEGKTVTMILLPMLAGILPLLALRWRINVITLGDEEARTIGVNAGLVRLIVIVCSTLITAASVSVSGMIGWVGLVIPHLSRKLVGNDYRVLLPTSMLFGALFLLVVDDISRNLMATEIPIGILTAFIGAPFFLWLITRKGEVF